MGRPDGPSDLPVGLPVELVSLDENGASGFGCGQDDDIGGDALFGMDFNEITDLDRGGHT